MRPAKLKTHLGSSASHPNHQWEETQLRLPSLAACNLTAISPCLQHCIMSNPGRPCMHSKLANHYISFSTTLNKPFEQIKINTACFSWCNGHWVINCYHQFLMTPTLLLPTLTAQNSLLLDIQNTVFKYILINKLYILN